MYTLVYILYSFTFPIIASIRNMYLCSAVFDLWLQVTTTFTILSTLLPYFYKEELKFYLINYILMNKMLPACILGNFIGLLKLRIE